MLKELRVGIAGFGTVGSGLAGVMQANAEACEKRTGRKVVISAVADRDPAKKPTIEALGAQYVGDAGDLIDRDDVDVVVELIGGTTYAGTLIENALNAGKHVVTANKALLAEKGEPLFKLAAEKDLHLGFEAAVAGGIPIVQTIKETLAGNDLHTILGIMNGTANFVLTMMTEEGMDFDAALKLAQDKGYAEADPTLDIGGGDAGHKIVLLIRLAFGMHYPFEDLSLTGISGVTPLDIAFAEDFGCRIKLIAMGRKVDGKIEAGVFPALVPHSYLLASVTGSFNAVRLEGNGGPVMLYGYGAGDLPTGSAVLADILNIARGCAPNNTGFADYLAPPAAKADPAEIESKHYFRFTVADRPGVMAGISKALGDREISIENAVQKGDPRGGETPIVFFTHEAKAGPVLTAIQEIDEMDFIVAPTVHYRVL
jgi:homoserine dehydrogenase